MSAVSKARESLLRFWALGEPWETLRQRIADDEDLMAVVARHTPAANIAQEQIGRILFAAMAYLAAKHGFTVPADITWDSFDQLRASLLEHEDELASLLQRPAQVNNPLRCVALYPGLWWAARRVSRPIALVEIGPSLGLNLCMDMFSYEYLGVGRTGQMDSRCHLVAEVDDLATRGHRTAHRAFQLPEKPPIVSERIGLELNPVSMDDDSLAWMRAFHFPHSEYTFDEALAIRRQVPIEIVKGDASRTLAKGLSLVPDGHVPLLFHTAVAYQMSDSVRARLTESLTQVAMHRRLMYMTWAEEPARRGALLQVTDFDLARDKVDRRLLAFINRWEPVPKLEWVDPGPDSIRTPPIVNR